MMGSFSSYGSELSVSQQETWRNTQTFQGHIAHKHVKVGSQLKQFFFLTTIDEEVFILEIPKYLEGVARIFTRQDVEVKGAFVRTKQTREDSFSVLKVLNIRPI